MIDRGKTNVIGVGVDAVDYESAVGKVMRAAGERVPMAVSALAVHGVMTAVLDPEHRYRVNSFDLVLPDGQPVRWAMNLLHGAGLADRVYGPSFMWKTCEAAAAVGFPVFLYGSRQPVIDRLCVRLRDSIPGLRIAGAEPSKFRQLTANEKRALIERVRSSGAALTFVGLGCPRQEAWAFEYHDALGMPVIAVGAAFDFHAGTLPQAPRLLQRYGLEWVFRLVQEPRRLWRRYLYLNPHYVALVVLQLLGLKKFDLRDVNRPSSETSYG